MIGLIILKKVLGTMIISMCAYGVYYIVICIQEKMLISAYQHVMVIGVVLYFNSKGKKEYERIEEYEQVLINSSSYEEIKSMNRSELVEFFKFELEKFKKKYFSSSKNVRDELKNEYKKLEKIESILLKD